MRTPTRRLGAVVVTTAIALGGALSAPPAQATNYYSRTSSDWLASQLTHGVVHNDQYDYDDYGLSLDVFLALDGLGTHPAAASSVLDALAKDPTAYIGAGTEKYAGATGKLATAVELGDRSPTSFGGQNLITRLQGLMKPASSPESGRAVDRSTYGDYSSTITQSFVVRALAGVKASRTSDAVTFLRKQQCAAGFFRGQLENTGSSSSFACDAAAAGKKTPDVDATAFAVEALTAAKADGVTGLDDALARAGAWLVSVQGSGGSFTGDQGANTNTTGLAATALVLTGHRAEAERAAAWVTQRQVTAWTAQASPKLRGEVGAVAYDKTALAAGSKEGITKETRDQWRRATAQAALGVDAVRQLKVSAPTGYLHGGSSPTVRVTGLASGEDFSVRLGALSAGSGVAAPDGSATTRVTLPRSTRTLGVRVIGKTSRRTGSTTVKVLGPRTFGVSLSHRPIRRAHQQRVTASGLAPGEATRIYYRGARIWTGHASSTGKVTHSFGSGHALGRKKLAVRGAFGDRFVVTYFRVVR